MLRINFKDTSNSSKSMVRSKKAIWRTVYAMEHGSFTSRQKMTSKDTGVSLITITIKKLVITMIDAMINEISAY